MGIQIADLSGWSACEDEPMADTIPPNWSNWSGRLSATGDLIHARSEADVAARVSEASRATKTVRAVGASHSHMPLVPNDDVIIDLSGLSGVISTDPDARTAWIWAGTPIRALGGPLREAGLGLSNQGDIDRQAIAGAVATGTHGTGRDLRNLSASVVGARLVLASGDVVDCSEASNTDLWNAVRLNLGAIGVVTRLEMQLRDAYKLREVGTVLPFSDVAPDLDDLPNRSRHFEFFWMPERDLVVAKAIEETDEEPQYPIAREGRRVGWNYEVLPSHRPWKHTEMEYSVASDDGPRCMAEIRTMIMSSFPEMPWAVEYRTVAADDVWMSTAYQRQTVTISLHFDVSGDEEPMFRAAEEIFRSFEGKPHWGKVNYLDGSALGSVHQRWSDWWRVRDEHDPGGVFLNEYLSAIRP